MELRPYQTDCVNDTRQAFAQGFNAPLLVLPTGGGKTVIFTHIAHKASLRGMRVLLLGHRRELVWQMSAALKRWDCAHGIITPDAKITNSAVQVGMAQTLANRVKLDKSGRYQFDLIIIDECHHATRNSTWGRVIEHSPKAKLLGVSATPCRLDGKGLGLNYHGFFDKIILGPTMQELIDMGNLVRPVVYAPEHAIDLSGVKKTGGDFNQAALVGAVDRAKITGDAVEHYRRIADRRSAIAFTVTVSHAAHVVDEFKAAGYQAAVLTGTTPDKERAQMLKDLGNGSLHVLASCNVVSEGTDIPSVFAALLLRPTQSYALAMQQIGRALRPASGKDRAIILDHADNVRRHGLPTEVVDWQLSGLQRAKGGKSTPPTKVCTGCRCHAPLTATKCAECGNKFVKGGASRTDGTSADALPVSRDGVLVEMSAEMIERVRRKKCNELVSARTRDELIELGKQREYKNPEFWAGKILEDRKAYRQGKGG